MAPGLTDRLAEALPHLTARRGRRVVVKLGGSAMEEPAALTATMQDLVLLQLMGQQLVVVHGGGKAIDRELSQAGIIPRKIDGRRVTDAKTLDIVVRVLGQDVNAALVKQCITLGGRAQGSDDLLSAEQLPGELGFVGAVNHVDVNFIEQAMAQEWILFLPSLARDRHREWLNINADDAATVVATEWKADVLMFVTDTPGVLHNVDEPASRLAKLNSSEAQKLIEGGVITGGMVPKVQGCLAALEAGVERLQVLDGRVHHALLWESLSGECVGTEFVK